jgi:hypothetical protein
LLDPQTYRVIGINEKAISMKSAKVKNYPLKFSGIISMAWVDVALVGRPGARLRNQGGPGCGERNRSAARAGAGRCNCGYRRCWSR